MNARRHTPKGREIDVPATAEAKPRRGRPPLQWLTWADLMRLPAGTPVLIDRGQHEYRTVGRVISRVGGRLRIVTRDGTAQVLDPPDLERARVVEGFYDPGDPVLRRGVLAREWRGGVVRTEGTRVLVETVGGVEWVPEEQLEHPDDRDARERAAQPKYKPGPVAERSEAELANQHGYEERER